jgi:hypothetical protein
MASPLGFGTSDGQAALKLSVAPIVPFVRFVSHKVTVVVLVVADIVIEIVAATTAAPISPRACGAPLPRGLRASCARTAASRTVWKCGREASPRAASTTWRRRSERASRRTAPAQ